MIRNLTENEWKALIDAASLADIEWEEQSRHEAAYTRKREAVRRAINKVKQLAP